MVIISIEGNIGSGKSSCIKMLKSRVEEVLKQNKTPKNLEMLDFVLNKDSSGVRLGDKIIFLQEPVNEWLALTDSDGENILDKFYKNGHRWSYSFQMNVFITRAKNILKYGGDKIIVTERSILTDKNVFAELLFNEGKISILEWKLYNQWYDWLKNSFEISPDKIIYLKTKPEVSYKRIKLRGRVEEENIPLEYIVKVSENHDKWLMNRDNTIIVNVDLDFKKNSNTKRTILNAFNNVIVQLNNNL